MNIRKPRLLVNEQKVKDNIQKMWAKAEQSGATLRPHFKTHQSRDIGEWFREAGVQQIAVSSVDMAQYFMEAGWEDITIAFPYNPLEHEQIEKIACRVTLNILIESSAALKHLNQNVEAPVGYFVKVDVGTHRTGVDPHLHLQEIELLAQSQNSQHVIKGVLGHAGHSYSQLDQAKAHHIYESSLALLKHTRYLLGNEDLILSYGDTPTCSVLDDFSEADELRPGNFAFYDAIQHHFGSCRLDDIAVCLAAPVVAKHPERNEVVLFGGGVHLSKDFFENENGKHFGWVVRLDKKGWQTQPIGQMVRLSQEHGIMHADTEVIQSLEIGELVGILPVHSCLAADLQGYYLSLTGQRLHKMPKQAYD